MIFLLHSAAFAFVSSCIPTHKLRQEGDSLVGHGEAVGGAKTRKDAEEVVAAQAICKL
jgi:hypothetical protein